MGNDFEKHIKDSMNNPPEVPFDEGLWNDMESRLDGDKERKPATGFGFLPLLLLTLFTTSLAGFFYFQNYKAMERLDELEQQLNHQEEVKEVAVTEKHVTVIYDTIYNRIIVNQVQQSNYIPSGNTQTNKNIKSAAPYLFTPGNSTTSIDFRKAVDFSAFDYAGITKRYGQESLLNLVVKEKMTVEAYLASLPNFDSSVAGIASLTASNLKIDREISLPPIKILEKKQKKKLRIYLKEMKPTDFALSGTTGTFASLNLGGNGFNLRGTFQGELNFGKRFSLLAGGEYFSNDFSKKVGIDEIGTPDGFPDIPANSSEDKLLNIQGDFNYFQIPFGVKYVVFPRRYFYPYVAGGLIAGRTTRSRLEYTYERSASPPGVEYSVSRGQLLPRTFEMSAFWSTVGFQVSLNRNWSILMEGSSQFDLKKGVYKYENLSILKLSAGFRYRFR